MLDFKMPAICFTLLRILLVIALTEENPKTIPMFLIPVKIFICVNCHYRAAILEFYMASTLLDLHFPMFPICSNRCHSKNLYVRFLW